MLWLSVALLDPRVDWGLLFLLALLHERRVDLSGVHAKLIVILSSTDLIPAALVSDHVHYWNAVGRWLALLSSRDHAKGVLSFIHLVQALSIPPVSLLLTCQLSLLI